MGRFQSFGPFFNDTRLRKKTPWCGKKLLGAEKNSLVRKKTQPLSYTSSAPNASAMAWLPSFPNTTAAAAAVLPLRISQRCIPAVRREKSAALSVRSVGDAAAPRRATDSRSRRSRTLRPLRGGAQQRSGCPVCVSCRWPASRGCAAVCPRHSPPCTRRLDVAVCTRQLCSKPLHGIRRSAQCARRRPSGGIGASPGRSLLPRTRA